MPPLSCAQGLVSWISQNWPSADGTRVTAPTPAATAAAAGRWSGTAADNTGRRLDLVSVPLGTMALAALILGVLEGHTWGWTSAPVLGCFIGSLVVFVLVVLRSKVHPEPLIDLSLFRRRSFSGASVTTLLALSTFAQSPPVKVWVKSQEGGLAASSPAGAFYRPALSNIAVRPGARITSWRSRATASHPRSRVRLIAGSASVPRARCLTHCAPRV